MLHSLMLVPGPVNISLRVHEALVRPVLSPLQHEYRLLRQDLEHALLGCYGFAAEQWCAIPLAAPLSLAISEVIRCLCTVNSTAQCLRNNPHNTDAEAKPLGDTPAVLGIVMLDSASQQWLALARVMGVPTVVLDGHQIAASELAETIALWLKDHPDIRHVVLPQVTRDRAELLPIAELVPVLKQAQVEIILDASLSFAIEEISPEWPLSAIVCRSDAGLHAVPGLSVMIMQRKSLEGGSPDHEAQDIARGLKYWCNPTAEHNVPSQLLQACLSACEEHREAGGWLARRRRYQRQHEALARVMKRYGVGGAVSARGYASASALRGYRLPTLLKPKQFAQQLLGQGFILDATVHPERDCVMVSLMGDMDELVMSRLHHAVEDILHPISVHIDA